MKNIHLTRQAGVLGVTAVLVAALAACGSSNSTSGGTPSGGTDTSTGSTGSTGTSDIKLAAVLANTSDPFFATISCAAEAEAKTLGVTLKTYNSTSTDTNTIASNFQSAQLSSPDGLFVDPFNNNQFIAQYKTLMAKGVPVVTGSPTSPSTEYKAIYSSGHTAPLVSQVTSLVPSGAGSMVFLGGAPGIPPLELRTKPFVSAMQSARSDLKVLPTEYSGFDVNKATTDVSALILAHPDLKLIIAADGPDGLAAASAIKQAGKSGKIALIAFDAIPGEVDALKAGTVSALIAQNPTKIGQDSIKALVDYLQAHPGGGAVAQAGIEEVDNYVLTAKNVDDPASQPYLYKSGC